MISNMGGADVTEQYREGFLCDAQFGKANARSRARSRFVQQTLKAVILDGAGLGITFYVLEARHRPWWVSRTAAEAARVARRKEQILTSAPAIWALVVMIALTLPVLLGM